MAQGKYIALTGGVGGAKLALGLTQLLEPQRLAFIVNTGDDFEHLGLHVSPDIDTLIYTLAGESNPETGWGRRGESWQFMKAIAELGGEEWFKLGDRDLAMHVERSRRLADGERLGEIVARLAAGFAVRHPILPMSDDPVRTMVATSAGELPFQRYFVREDCEPRVTGFRFAGARQARPHPAIAAWLEDPDLAGIILCPSNPFVSIDPILATGDLRERLRRAKAPLVSISPIIGGNALKGPTAKMMRELTLAQSATQVARHYRDLASGFVLDEADAALAPELQALGIAPCVTRSVMRTLEDRIALARAVLDFIEECR